MRRLLFFILFVSFSFPCFAGRLIEADSSQMPRNQHQNNCTCEPERRALATAIARDTMQELESRRLMVWRHGDLERLYSFLVGDLHSDEGIFYLLDNRLYREHSTVQAIFRAAGEEGLRRDRAPNRDEPTLTVLFGSDDSSDEQTVPAECECTNREFPGR